MAKDPKQKNAPQGESSKADAPQGTNENPIRVAQVPPPPPEDGFDAGAGDPSVRAGLAPIDPEKNQEEAERREDLTNMQTQHEAENVLDSVSGTPTPGVTDGTPLTAKQVGAPVTDEAGRPALSSGDKDMLDDVRKGLSEARRDDQKNERVPDQRKGWRTPEQLGIPGGVVRRIADAYSDRIEMETAPNGHFFPDTGVRYRLK